MYYGIDHRKSSAMRPQTQGLVERTNRSILTTLRSFVNTSQTDWDTYLAPCT